MKPQNVQVYYLFRCDDPNRPTKIKPDVSFDLDDIGKVRQLKSELDELGINYDLLIERFDNSLNVILSNDYIVEKNHLNA